jgi:hypothetical protein
MPVGESPTTLCSYESSHVQSHTVKASDGTEPQHKEAVRTFDLCNGSKIALSTLFMTNRLTLTWDPPDPSLADKMAAKRLVITAVGISTYTHTF